MDIYVGNLAYDATDEDLSAHFQSYGEVSSVKIILDRETGRSRGFAFVTMPNDDEGSTAIENLNGAEFLGRELKIRKAEPRPERPSGGRNFGGGGGGGRSFGGGGGGRGGYGGDRKGGGKFGGGDRDRRGGNRDRRF